MLKRQFIPRNVLRLFIALLIVSSACSDDDNLPTGSDATSIIELSFSGLKPLNTGLNYQAWVIEYYSGYFYGHPLEIFNVNENGQMVDVSGDSLLAGEFEVNIAAENIYGFVISIEPLDVMATTPSYSIILGGAVSEGQAVLTVEDELGIGVSFEGAAGKYILATPTDNINTNENSGIWFLDLTSGISLNGFNLPELPAGWEYEGWVIRDGTYISTGKFSQFTTADESANYSGPVAGPPFPGEDFLQNAPEGLSFPLGLAGASVMITIEPWNEYDDNEEEPFVKILVADIPPDAVDHITYDMSASNESFPTGTATIK